MRGFPIRTSSDHGSFANSPRLIAGYHVLLRLLVPRHPPCALINLTTKIIQRCSRPLCSSQATTGSPNPLAGAYPTHVERYDRPGPARRPSPHRDSRRRPDPGTSPEYNNLPAVPSGPNSVPSQPLRPVDLRSLPTASCRRTRSHRPSKPASSRCSTLEHHLAIVRRERGPGQPHPPMTGELAARCSLERR